jgi:PQQ-like domain
MFRGAPDHTSAYTSKPILFTDEAWRFNAKAPIRSTAAASASTVYFGSSDGKLYALDKLYFIPFPNPPFQFIWYLHATLFQGQ